MPEMPYEETTDDDYGVRAARSFSATTVQPGTVELSGPCPRCGAVIHAPVVTDIYKSFRLRGRSAPAPAERIEPLICTCDHDHPGRPDDRVGCGAYWLLRFEAS